MKMYGGIVFSLLLCFGITTAQADYTVLMQESPPGAGEIKPGVGVHSFNASETVNITTAPKAGYHFVSWLGDVADPTSNNTQLTVDGPKIIIAVFERDEFSFSAADSPQISNGPEALYPRSDSYTNSVSTMSEPPDEPDNPDDPYDPEDPDDPVPEPLTIALLGLGSTYVFRKQLLKI
jgi:hypothetical protein